MNSRTTASLPSNGAKSHGLEGIVVAETCLSSVDGEKGELLIAGYDAEAIAERISFEQICGLLWRRNSVLQHDETELRKNLARYRCEFYHRLMAAKIPLQGGMDYLRSAVSCVDVDGENETVALTAAVAVATAVWWRHTQKLTPIAPRSDLSHVCDFLRMALGQTPSAAQEKALTSYLVTVSDHGLNASTFAARVVASTGSDMTSAVVAGIGALKGPLHGGAPGPVLDMLDAIGSPENARDWMESALAQGQRIMGMGHRIYRVRDPRAAILEKAMANLESTGVQTRHLPLARSVEKAAVALLRERYPNRPLQANVEFYTAVLLDAIGLPRQLFSLTFAVGRVVGWCAHVLEQRQVGRLIRPDSRYVGTLRQI